MRVAWTEPGLDDDAGMNIGLDKVDLRDLKAFEDALVATAGAHVEALRMTWWQRRKAVRTPKHVSGLATPPS